ncbi:hypothetical protein [Pseudomonas sp. dw_612]|uniref:antitoxin PaaA2 family protein n=1 Tax=Pseudomonas sp. dw_612 TaxID=2720080 RepID=UPI001BD6DC0F|nr:hypothetical protein [Pseudomonas sp. dw_612]
MPAKNDNAVFLMRTKMSETQQQLNKEAYDAWFRAQVQASLNDPRPSISDEEARRLFAIKREKLRRGEKL